ncbi:MAG TPA: pRL2-19 [Streptomyces sp.]|nr:pRL2-19 [Streptomyces sp.]
MTTTPGDLSHAMLIAILMHHGGSLDLPAGAFDPDAIGGRDGAFHAVAMEPQTDGTVRISVRPRPDGDDAGITRI